MKISRICLLVLAFAAMGLAGCGGLNASHSVSPLGFFVPGIVSTIPSQDHEVDLTEPPSAPSQKI